VVLPDILSLCIKIDYYSGMVKMMPLTRRTKMWVLQPNVKKKISEANFRACRSLRMPCSAGQPLFDKKGIVGHEKAVYAFHLQVRGIK